MLLRITLTLAWVVALASLAGAAPLRDGQRFDPGATLTSPAENAPAALADLVPLLGDWSVTFTRHHADGTHHRTEGAARITFMNKGHAFMERFHAVNSDTSGIEINTLTFFTYPPAQERWVVGVGSSYTENITLYDGTFRNDRLVVEGALRKLGGAVVTRSRMTWTVASDAIQCKLETSTDGGDTWSPKETRAYVRSKPNLLFNTEGLGSVTPDRAAEAAAFDFLLGEWAMQHDMTFPNGQSIQYPGNATAVTTLNGHGILEFSWLDVDPNLPDASTSILRLYNRQMRRWESMYTTNRFNGILYFGGVQEGNRIVLHNFDADLSDVPISYWIFHDVESDAYSWHAETSTDRGRTWKDTWIIQATRKP